MRLKDMATKVAKDVHQCKFCSKTMHGRHLGRWRLHILKCPKAIEAIKVACISEVEENQTVCLSEVEENEIACPSEVDENEIACPSEVEENNQSALLRYSRSPDSTDTSLSFSQKKRRRLAGNYLPIEVEDSAVKMPPSVRHNFDFLYARYIFAQGYPFYSADSLYAGELFQTFGLKVPNRKQIAGTLLEEVYQDTYNSVNGSIEQVRLTDGKPYLTVVTDGWTRNRQHFNNYVLVTPYGQKFFHKMIETGHEKQNATCLADQLLNVIEEVGPDIINAISTDNATMLAATRKVQETYPHIYGINCAAHQLNLLLGDITKLEWFSSVWRDVQCLLDIFHQGPKGRHFLRKAQQEASLDVKMLVVPVVTRWQSWDRCLKSLLENKSALRIICDWVNTVETKNAGSQIMALDDDEKLLLEISKSSIYERLKLTSWWDNIAQLHQFIRAITMSITFLEEDNIGLSRVYGEFVDIFEAARKSVPEHFLPEVWTRVMLRWLKVFTPEVGLASLLDVTIPESHRLPLTRINGTGICDWLLNRYGVKQGAAIYLELIELIDNPTSFTGYSNEDVSEIVLQCGSTARWWSIFMANKKLAAMATELLSIQPTSAATERNWSYAGYIPMATRNQLSRPALEKAVYVYTNARALAKPRVPRKTLATQKRSTAPEGDEHIDESTDRSILAGDMDGSDENSTLLGEGPISMVLDGEGDPDGHIPEALLRCESISEIVSPNAMYYE